LFLTQWILPKIEQIGKFLNFLLATQLSSAGVVSVDILSINRSLLNQALAQRFTNRRPRVFSSNNLTCMNGASTIA